MRTDGVPNTYQELTRCVPSAYQVHTKLCVPCVPCLPIVYNDRCVPYIPYAYQILSSLRTRYVPCVLNAYPVHTKYVPRAYPVVALPACTVRRTYIWPTSRPCEVKSVDVSQSLQPRMVPAAPAQCAVPVQGTVCMLAPRPEAQALRAAAAAAARCGAARRPKRREPTRRPDAPPCQQYTATA